jgi:hypothetical protein
MYTFKLSNVVNPNKKMLSDSRIHYECQNAIKSIYKNFERLREEGERN